MSTRIVVAILLGVVIYTVGIVGAAPPRSFIVAVNDDGFSGFFNGRYVSEQALTEKIGRYRDGATNLFEWCVSVGGTANYQSHVVEVFGDSISGYARRGDSVAATIIRSWIAEGRNPLDVAVQACREIGVSCYASIQMNEYFNPVWTSGALAREFNGSFWMQRAELRIRTVHGSMLPNLTYGAPEVRTRYLQWIREILSHDLDGINLDFLRHPPVFGYEDAMVRAFREAYHSMPDTSRPLDSRWMKLRQAIMNDFIGTVHHETVAAAARWNHPVGLSVRIDQRDFAFEGFDVERWIKEGWIDILVVAQEGLGGYTFQVRDFLSMAANTGCAVVFGEESFVQGDDQFEEGKPPRVTQRYMPVAQALERVIQWKRMGMQGVHLFNGSERYDLLKDLKGI